MSEPLFAPYQAPNCTSSTSSRLLPITGLARAQQDGFQPPLPQTLIYPCAKPPRVLACLSHAFVPGASAREPERLAVCRSPLPERGWRGAVPALLPRGFQLKKEDALAEKGVLGLFWRRESVVQGRWKRPEGEAAIEQGCSGSSAGYARVHLLKFLTLPPSQRTKCAPHGLSLSMTCPATLFLPFFFMCPFIHPLSQSPAPGMYPHIRVTPEPRTRSIPKLQPRDR